MGIPLGGPPTVHLPEGPHGDPPGDPEQEQARANNNEKGGEHVINQVSPPKNRPRAFGMYLTPLNPEEFICVTFLRNPLESAGNAMSASDSAAESARVLQQSILSKPKRRRNRHRNRFGRGTTAADSNQILVGS